MMRAILSPLRFLIWLAVPLALYGGWQLYGLPHVIWAYEFIDNGRPYDLTAKRHYLSCTFIGPYGAFTTPASGGRCGWVRLFKNRGDR